MCIYKKRRKVFRFTCVLSLTLSISIRLSTYPCVCLALSPLRLFTFLNGIHRVDTCAKDRNRISRDFMAADGNEKTRFPRTILSFEYYYYYRSQTFSGFTPVPDITMSGASAVLYYYWYIRLQTNSEWGRWYAFYV